MKIEILKIVENEDGTCDVTFDYDDEFVDMIKKELQKEDVSEEEINMFVVESLQKGIDLLNDKQENNNE